LKIRDLVFIASSNQLGVENKNSFSHVPSYIFSCAPLFEFFYSQFQKKKNTKKRSTSSTRVMMGTARAYRYVHEYYSPLIITTFHSPPPTTTF
jgi:hypothetical protein